MKKILLMCMVAGVLFACNKQAPADIEDENATGKSDVTISIKQAPSSRGITDQKGDTEYAVISSGKIYFLNSSNTNIYQRELTTAEINTLKNTTSTAGGNSITITGVPSTATSLFFLANTYTADGPTFPVVDGTGSTGARVRIDKLQGDAMNVSMSGHSGPFGVGIGTNKTASVLLAPLVARVELGQVTCQNQNTPGAPISSDITGYKLSGVFINNVHQGVLLNGTHYAAGPKLDIKAQAGWLTGGIDQYFMSNNTVFPYYQGGSIPTPADWVINSMVDFCSPANAGMSFYPDPNTGATDVNPNVTPKLAWAYQVTPGLSVPMGTSDPDVPHIILKLTDVTYVAPELTNTVQYITVTKYKDADTNDAITKFERGNVYRITNLIFTHNEATDEPYQKDIVVTATVTVAPWVINNINPDWD